MAAGNPRIGFIGVGLMGHGIAKNLLAKGFPLTVRAHRNRAPVDDLVAKGAKEASSHAELARNAEIVFLCVTGAPQVEEAIFGADGVAKGAQKGLTIIDTSTSEPATTTKMREALAPLGVRFVDAPLARTPVEAEQGRLNIMVGADEATFAELKPVFAAFDRVNLSPERSPLSSILPTIIWNNPEFTAPAEINSWSLRSDNPDFAAAAQASAVAVQIACATKLLMSLIMRP